MARVTTVQEAVEYGIEDLDDDRVVEIPLQDLVFAYKAFGELIRFFQDPSHFRDIDAVAEFVGNTEEGALRVCWEAQHERLIEALPDDVTQSIEAGELDHPEPPDYRRKAGPADDFEDEDLGEHGYGEDFDDDDDDDDLGGLFDDIDFDD